MKGFLYSTEEIRDSRRDALEKVKKFLAPGDSDSIAAQFADRDKGHWSRGKFVVTWKANFRGKLPCEERLDLCDSFYASYSGYQSIRVSVSLFHEKQLAGYGSIHLGLLKVGLMLSPWGGSKRRFFTEFCVPYNEAFNAKREVME